MAHQSWEFDCREQCILAEPRCTRCGRSGTYAGWSRSIIEMWSQYHRFFRLSPLGLQHRIAEEMLGPVTGKCRDCNGSGLEATLGDWGFDNCTSCDGTGRIRLCSEEEFERLREEVLRRAGDSADTARQVELGRDWSAGESA